MHISWYAPLSSIYPDWDVRDAVKRTLAFIGFFRKEFFILQKNAQ